MSPQSSAAAFEQAFALHRQGKGAEALAIYGDLARVEPDNVGLNLHFGILLGQMGQMAEGERVLRRLLPLAPDFPALHQALAFNLMGQGQYEEGWRFYEARHKIPGLALPPADGFPFPQWRGEALAGKRIAILPEQGFGDQIQFARFIPALRDAGAKVTFLVAPELVSLFDHSLPGVQVMAAAGSVEFPDPDYWAMAGALVGRLSLTPETLPAAAYLRSPAPTPALPDGFKVGVQLRGNPRHANDAQRSLPAEIVDHLRAALPGTVIGLDPAETGAKDFAQTAAIIEQLDLVVTVDTSVAHLAGALGKPTFVLLPHFGTDWRWMRDRADSPWYPSATLYRRGADDADWTPTIERLARDVHALAQAR